ncbi:MAG: Fe-S protein assembly co-chaperone HscB [Planctomycetota bacterium]|nr:Fe-S protein assembly co-chaperone HscB [Planctomycetota bacterium]
MQDLETAPDPFQALGVSMGYELDAEVLRKHLLALQRRMHPDFFGDAEPEVRARAERSTAELNSAYEILADDRRRADWLVKSRGGPDEEQERQMPQAFLMEVLEWNETLEAAQSAAPGTPERAALDELEETLRTERGRLMDAIGGMLAELPAEGSPVLADVRKELNAVRYVDRTLATMRELRLEQAAGTTS